MKKLKNIFKSIDRIFFHAGCDLPADPLIPDRAQVQAIAYEIWKVTVKDNKKLTNGHKTQHWCCQDECRKQVAQLSQREGAKHRDTLNISCCTNPKSEENTCTITIWLEHHMRHTPYYDVVLPPEAPALIQEGLEWSCPNEITKRVQSAYLSITANQVHVAWTKMSETLWKRGTQQLPSVRTLLEELKDDAALLDLPAIEGVKQVAWVMTKIMVFPLSYCLLTMTTSVEDQKRTRALEAWAVILHDKYGMFPKFVHTDKDMAEIGASRSVWPEAKHQLSIKRRIKGNLPTSPYNAHRAARKHPFIDLAFKPYGRADPNDYEGSVPGEIHEQEIQSKNTKIALTSGGPNSIKFRIPTLNRSTQHLEGTGGSASGSLDKPTSSRLGLLEDLSDPDEETVTGRRTFCPIEQSAAIVDMMERHFSTYQFCVFHDLPNLWAYLWENWYRHGRWELWARSADPREIPRLKTTMFVEAHWWRVKEDYLNHFSLPRLDLLAWVLLTKLAPTYYRKIEVVFNGIGRFRELPRWRKDFKAAWKKAMRTPITMPLNETYQPDAKQFHLVQQFHPVDPQFFLQVMRNRTLPFWSHLSLKPLPTVAAIIKEDCSTIADSDGDNKVSMEVYVRVNTAGNEMDNSDPQSDNDDVLIDTGGNVEKKTVKEEMENYIHIIRDFCDGLEFQVQFQDQRFLRTLERESAGFLKLMQNCLSRERRLNSSRAASPSTWERTTTNVHAVITTPE
ncbi:hypothetical protein EDB85DRAFT_2075228 [Lactarius pseudohatsudake]|nr:hypothetical protein EDB85DRAFT_2075228 [Lactarius pseudohatsudake]